jgi:hypothetical protein
MKVLNIFLTILKIVFIFLALPVLVLTVFMIWSLNAATENPESPENSSLQENPALRGKNAA